MPNPAIMPIACINDTIETQGVQSERVASTDRQGINVTVMLIPVQIQTELGLSPRLPDSRS
jgi:hypothetical protein